MRISVTARDRFVKLRHTTIVTGQVTSGGKPVAGTLVRLYTRQPGTTAWKRTAGIQHTTLGGRYALRVFPLEGQEVQVRALGKASVAARIGMVVPVTVTAVSEGGTPVPGKTFEYVGATLSRLKGTPVKIQRKQPAGNWVNVAYSRVNPDGQFSVRVPAGTSGDWRIRALVDTGRSAWNGTAVSAEAYVRPRDPLVEAPITGVRLASAEVTQGATFTILADTAPKLAGKPVNVDAFRPGRGWTKVGSGTINSAGRIVGTGLVDTTGHATVRVSIPAVAYTYLAAKSSTVVLTVTAPVICNDTPDLCTYEYLDGAALVTLANAERAAANPSRVAAGKEPLDPLVAYPTNELQVAADDCAMENARDTSTGLHHCADENLYGGTRSTPTDPAAAMAKWMDSPAHRAAILDPFSVYSAGSIIRRSDGVAVAVLAFN